MSDAALELRGIAKRFGYTTALAGASLHVRPGTIHALLGENGAGKTTLMRIAFGMIRPDAGTMRLNSIPYHPSTPRDAIAAGLGMVHQHFTIVRTMTVAENVALGGRGTFDHHAAALEVRETAAYLGLQIDPDSSLADLHVAAQQRVEIIKALAGGARILVLDEPTAVLTPGESRELLQRLRTLAARGMSLVIITHKLRDALEFADDVTVLRAGQTVLSAPAAELDTHRIASAMIGTGTPGATGRDLQRASKPPGETVLALEHVWARDERGVTRLRDATMTVHAGEIVGVAGIDGSGERELLRLLAGRLEPARGIVRRPPEVGFVPEDRLRDALIADFTLAENVALHGLGRRKGRIPWTAVRDTTRKLLQAFDVRAAGPDVRASVLSGGNQQKLVLGREIGGAEGRPLHPTGALVAENPTRGLDVSATMAVHERLLAARAAGTAIVLYSADIDELVALCDRIVVTAAGSVSEAPRDRESVGRAMLGS